MSPGRRLQLGLALLAIGLTRLLLAPVQVLTVLLLVLALTAQGLLERVSDWLQAKSSTCWQHLGSRRSDGSAASS